MPVRFGSKFLTCLVLALLLAGTGLLTGVPPRPAWLSDRLTFGAVFLGLIAPLFWLPVWVWLEKRKALDSRVVISRLQEGIAYLTGFGIAIFGWKKILHLQFRVPISFADRPASQLDGETLTWFYFGHSYIFGCIVGLLQIAGALLLFFRRTRLAGAIVLFPVMLNILLINIFYQMNAGALLQSILLTLGLIYILGLHAPVLLAALFSERAHSTGRDRRILRKWIAPVIAGGLAFMFVRELAGRVPPQSPLYGRYAVDKLSTNGVAVQRGDNDSVLTRVYFDLDGVCVLEYNSQQRQLIANYRFTDTSHPMIEARFPGKKDFLPFRAVVRRIGAGRLSLVGCLATDSIAMILRKIE